MEQERSYTIHKNIGCCYTFKTVAKKEGRYPTEADLDPIEKAAVVVQESSLEIEWVGKEKELPKQYLESQVQTTQSVDHQGKVLLPALVECHTHLIYGGCRTQDYAMRVSGKSYQEIAAAGGGILRTVRATRETSTEELFDLAQKRIQVLYNRGVRTLEIKSGYGLSWESEIKILSTIQNLQESWKGKLQILSTFLPAHTCPPEFYGKNDEYVEEIQKNWIPEVAKKKLATFFDVFIEKGAFSLAQAKRLCEAAKEHGFELKLHVDQFTDLGSIPWAVEMGAVSVDHLEQISEKNLSLLAKATATKEQTTTAVLLPGAAFFLGVPFPPARKLLDAGVRVALSTDHNPGTCPSLNPALMMTIACSQMKMTPAEALVGVTYNAACALGLEKEIGSFEVGKKFVFCTLGSSSEEGDGRKGNVQDPTTLAYFFGEI